MLAGSTWSRLAWGAFRLRDLPALLVTVRMNHKLRRGQALILCLVAEDMGQVADLEEGEAVGVLEEVLGVMGEEEVAEEGVVALVVTWVEVEEASETEVVFTGEEVDMEALVAVDINEHYYAY